LPLNALFCKIYLARSVQNFAKKVGKMGYCVNCLYQGDNSLDEQGNGRIFCMVKRKWVTENYSCGYFTEYADLSKEIRSQFALEVIENSLSSNKTSKVVNQYWKSILVTFIFALASFILIVKFFEKYVF
jgi:hypothetical protein